MGFSDGRNGGTLDNVSRRAFHRLRIGKQSARLWLGGRAMKRSLPRRLRVAQVGSGFTALAAMVLFAMPAATTGQVSTRAADSAGAQAALASAHLPGTRLSAAARQQLASIASQVHSLIGKMTLPEKIGQLEMSGPTGDNGTPGQTR